MADINKDHVTLFLESVTKDCESVTYQMIGNYRKILRTCERLCRKTMDDTNVITMECKRCGKTHELPRNMRFMAVMPVCFRCQEDWIDSFYKRCEAKSYCPTY